MPRHLQCHLWEWGDISGSLEDSFGAGEAFFMRNGPLVTWGCRRGYCRSLQLQAVPLRSDLGGGSRRYKPGGDQADPKTSLGPQNPSFIFLTGGWPHAQPGANGAGAGDAHLMKGWLLPWSVARATRSPVVPTGSSVAKGLAVLSRVVL